MIPYSQLRPAFGSPIHIPVNATPFQCESRAVVGNTIYRCGLDPYHEGDHERKLVGPPGYGEKTITWQDFYTIAEED